MIERDLCSPSQLNLRFHCAGSANLQKKLPASGDKSDAAERGVLLHAVTCELLGLGKNIEAYNLSSEDREAVEWCLQKVFTDVLSRFETPPILKREFQIDLSELGIQGGLKGCRIDQLFVIPGIGSIVIDEKFGVGYVSAPKWNWQFKAYAWGAWKAFGGNVECIKLQPAADEEKQYQSHLFESEDFEKIGSDIKAIVEATKAPDAPLIRGPHCDYLYCKCRDICPAHRQAVLEIPSGIMVRDHIRAIEPEQRRKLYENLVVAQAWCKKAVEVIGAMILDSTIEIPGYGIGEGKRSYAWADEDKAQVEIANFIMENGNEDPLQIMELSHLKSKSQIEEIIGKSKKAQELLKPLLVTVPGKPCVRALKEDK